MRRLPAMPGSGGDDRGDRGHDSLVGGGGNEFQGDEQGVALSTTVHTAIVDGEARGRGVEGGPFFAVVPRPLSVPRGSLDNMRAGRGGSRARN